MPHQTTTSRFGWILLSTSAFLLCNTAPSLAAEPTSEQVEFFEKRIRPLLNDHCYDCHGPDADADDGGELKLSSRAAILRGGESGPAVEPGRPDDSLLISAVRYNDPLLQMPPDKKLAQRQIADLEQWVAWGLPDPRADNANDTGRPGDDEPPSTLDWWSFQPIGDPALPQLAWSEWTKAPIDAFVLAGLKADSMQPPPQADRRTLLRRVYFDLIGLPPTPAEAEAFLSDTAPGAFARLVDQLLASPHYGERWGRHWLDVVRYADTSGCNGDFPLPEAYRYRNYVIASWNGDKPFDQFIREQLAGDILSAAPGKSDAERYEQIVATGYLAISRRFSSLAEEFHLTLDDTVDNLGKAILGLTVSCARCHSHKFDPIPQADYYALYGVFASTRYAFPGTEIYRHTRHLTPLVPFSRLEKDLHPRLTEIDQLDEEIFETYTSMAALDTGAAKDALRAEWQELKVRRDNLLKALPAHERAYAASEGTANDIHLHIKGDPEKLGPVVRRGFLQVLGGHQLAEDVTDSGRLQLASWVTSAKNPLTARVIVNRVWQHHFGKGIVRTPNDFGTRGTPPTHPAMLDYLTQRLLNSGWSIKALHREILLSETYRMAAVDNAAFAKRDPDNTRIWTFERRRLDAETIRDSMLAISGMLNCSTGGRHPFAPEWEWRYTQHVPFIGDFPTNRRSIYLMQQRIRQQPYLAVFDGADTNVATGKRQVSTTPQQALFMLNSKFVHEQATVLARRLARACDQTREQVILAYELALGRPPQSMEVDEALDYVRLAVSNLRIFDPHQRKDAAMASFLRTLLSSNEFIFVE